ncbi:hypothetical protein NDU88_000651 [Pleurodeles waltl]|uniref:Secreted protein n=1 Tax=Pleurodeles waltl TaxID=8319 RepID=A0AAV7V9L2_PLEWA|nr:hypothetical protein NDU88_000651 [Pleurodeles waltl]
MAPWWTGPFPLFSWLSYSLVYPPFSDACLLSVGEARLFPRCLYRLPRRPPCTWLRRPSRLSHDPRSEVCVKRRPTPVLLLIMRQEMELQVRGRVTRLGGPPAVPRPKINGVRRRPLSVFLLIRWREMELRVRGGQETSAPPEGVASPSVRSPVQMSP